jgi:hypothetical protein
MAGLGSAVAPARGGPTAAWMLIAATLLVTIVTLGASTPDAQMFIVLTAIIALIGVWLIPRAAARDGVLSPRFLAFALAAHIVGSLLRYAIIQAVYHGVADANGYYGAGVRLAPLFRTLQFPVFPNPGTGFMNFMTGLLFSVTGPTMLGGFVVCASAGFVGSWYFYKAFRLEFPDGDAKTFAYLIFLLPSMWYWPSSLGKDGLIVLFLGSATYGFALLLRGRFAHGIVVAAFGLFGTIMIRPPMAAALAVAAAAVPRAPGRSSSRRCSTSCSFPLWS